MSVMINKTNLIVNYLPQNLSDQEFHDLFQNAGNLTASKIVRDKASGYSYGFGFVDYETEEDAENAIKLLNGHKIDHKVIKVSFSRIGDNVKGSNLYIRNLPKDVTEEDLMRVFSPYGEIVQVRVLLESDGTSKGVGFVLFSMREQSEQAMHSLDGRQPPGFSQPINIKFAEDNKNKMKATMASVGYSPTGMSPTLPMPQPQFAFNNGQMRNQLRMNRFSPMNPPMPPGSNFMPPAPQTPHLQGFVLFVYNIGTEADDFELWKLFSTFGVVKKTAIIKDQKNENQCKGYGFVTMASYEEAAFAIQNLHGFNYNGRQLQVSFKS